MTLSLPGALVGSLLALAVILLAGFVVARRPLSLPDRIGPYVGLPGHTRIVDRRLRLRRRTPSTQGAVRARATVAGSRQQAMVLGAMVGILVGLVLTADAPQPLALLAFGVVGCVGGRWTADLRMRAAERRRTRHIEEHVPVLADLLALAVSAGASPVAALERAGAAMTGPLADDVDDAVARVRAGESVDVARDDLGSRSASLRRLVDAVLVAQDRGTPLADVLRAQAHDARAEERRRLMESAGRKDVLMLVPIVFLVLPSVVVIALFPAMRALEAVVD